MATLSNDLRHALMLTTGALVAVVGSGSAKEADRVNFTGEFADLGSMSIKEVLDAADVALGCDVGLQSVAAERGRAAQAVINWLIEQTGADEAQAIMHPLVASILRPRPDLDDLPSSAEAYAAMSWDATLGTPVANVPPNPPADGL